MTATRKLYAIKAYGFPGHPFPKFMDSMPGLEYARRQALQLVRDGWRYVEILRELPRPAGHEFGAHWEVAETQGVA